MTFRIMPAQRLDQHLKSGKRYGVIIPGHPCGVVDPAPDIELEVGDFVASWATRAEAEAARFALGIDPDRTRLVYCIVPEENVS